LSRSGFNFDTKDIVMSRAGTAALDGLLTPFGFGAATLPNRIVMAPMTRMFSPGGVPGEDVAEYYRRRAAGGVGLIITEGAYIPHPAAGPSRRVPRLWGDQALAGWQRAVDAVHAEGGAIIPQLWHLGIARGANPKFNPDVVSLGPSGIGLDGAPAGRAATAEDLDELVDAYVTAAVNAKAVGFDGIELHGAHGYLLDQFLWARTNQRDDEYGGSLAKRAAFPARVVRAVRSAVGPEFPVVFRFSQWKSGAYDAKLAETSAELGELLGILGDAGVSVLHPSARRFWDPAFPAEDPELSLAGWARRLTGLPTITVGSVGLDKVFTASDGAGVEASAAVSIEPLLRRFEAGEFDLVAVGRALISDAHWVRKHAAGQSTDIVAYDPAHREVLV
jgi:2,4-dienoyl-CoA reductase-like NADH-dependent reductase (Old Yellow Enzyme family)